MNIRITGFFKFRPIKTISVKIPDGTVSEVLLRHAAGQDVFFAKSSSRDAWNAVVGKCAEAGWYRNGGWLPNGSASVRCGVKDRGDVLGICVTFFDYAAGWGEKGLIRSWIYCDKAFEQAVLEDFFQPDERLKFAIKYTICGSLTEMKALPSQKWLDNFCKKTHDTYRFTINRFGRSLTDDEIAELSAKCPKLKKYIRLMLVKNTDNSSAKTA